MSPSGRKSPTGTASRKRPATQQRRRQHQDETGIIPDPRPHGARDRELRRSAARSNPVEPYPASSVVAMLVREERARIEGRQGAHRRRAHQGAQAARRHRARSWRRPPRATPSLIRLLTEHGRRSRPPRRRLRRDMLHRGGHRARARGPGRRHRAPTAETADAEEKPGGAAVGAARTRCRTRSWLPTSRRGARPRPSAPRAPARRTGSSSSRCSARSRYGAGGAVPRAWPCPRRALAAARRRARADAPPGALHRVRPSRPPHLPARRRAGSRQDGPGAARRATSPNAYPLLVVVPNVVKINWAREVEKWTPQPPRHRRPRRRRRPSTRSPTS